MGKLSNYEELALDKLHKSVLDGRWSREGLVHLFELSGIYSGVMTIPDAARATGKTYNGIKKTREIREIMGIKFVIDLV